MEVFIYLKLTIMLKCIDMHLEHPIMVVTLKQNVSLQDQQQSRERQGTKGRY